MQILKVKAKQQVDYNSWPLDWLSIYIEKLQRKTLTNTSKEVLQNIRLVKVSRAFSYSLLVEMEKSLTASVTRYSAHMLKEERHLFPFIREMMLAKELNRCINRAALDKIEYLIQSLKDEHELEKRKLNANADLRKNCEVVLNHSRTASRLFFMLTTFDEACELHMHLQNRFLFPKIIAEKYGGSLK